MTPPRFEASCSVAEHLYGAEPGSGGAAPRDDAWTLISGAMVPAQVIAVARRVALDHDLGMTDEPTVRRIRLLPLAGSGQCGTVEIRWRPRPPAPCNTLSYLASAECGLEVLITPTDPAMVEAATAVGAELQGLACAYSPGELDGIIASMPLVDHYSTPDAALDDWALIFRDHYLQDSVGFLCGMERAGIPPAWIFALTKGDRTHDRDRVHAAFLARGYRSDILDNAAVDRPDGGPHSAQLRRVTAELDAFIDRAHAEGRKVLVVDDGGLVARGYAAQEAPRRVDAAVELTVSGLKRIKAAGPLAIPVLNIARSQLKTHLGYLEIADACMRRMRTILPAHKFIGRPVLLFGFGTLGSRLAPQLRTLGCQVSVVDTDILALIAAAEAGYPTYLSAAAALRAMQPFLIVGATGEIALTAADLADLPDGAYLAPFATRDFSVLTDPATAPRSVEIPSVGRRYTLSDGHDVVLLGEGRSLNLFESDSIPNQGYDAYRAGTIIAIKHLCATFPHVAPGLHVDLVDAAVARSGLYHAYYERYLAPTGTRTTARPRQGAALSRA